MTLIEHLDNYAKRSLAHQLTLQIATQPSCRNIVREVHYERTDRPNGNKHFPSHDAGVIIFNTNMAVRIIEVNHPTFGYGLGVIDTDVDGNTYNQRNYYRHDRRDLTDAQWRQGVTTRIADIAARTIDDYAHHAERN